MSGGWCGNTWKASWPGGVCPGSTDANPIVPTQRKGGGNEPAEAANNTVSDNAPWMADTSPVRIGYSETTYSGGIPSVTENATTTVYEAMDDFRSMYTKAHVADADPADVARYDNLLSQMRKVTGSKLGTKDSQQQAYYSILQYASRAGVNAEDLLRGAAPSGGGGSGSRGAYTGPRESIMVQAESDINATANALALEMIGRPLSEKELAKVTKRIRGAEMEQPQVTTGDVKRSVTTQGLTAQGREDILRELIAERPEFEKYQLDTTVMDAMNAYIQEKQAVIDV